MRITNSMMMRNYLGNLNNNLSSLTDIQSKVASGRAITRLSDDPLGLISVMSGNAKLQKNSEYKDTVDSATAWLKQSETAVYELNKVLQSAYEQVVSASSDEKGAQKQTAADYIKELRDQIITIANSQSGDSFIFGGHNVTTKPFTIDSTGKLLYNGIDLSDVTDPANKALIDTAKGESVRFEVGVGIVMDISTTGVELLGSGENNIYKILDDLYNDMMDGTKSASDLGGYITKIQDAQSRVLSTQSKIGGTINRMELLTNRYEDEDLAVAELKSKVEDVDIAEAYMKYIMAVTVYNSALQVGTEIIQASILDYLR